MDLFGSTKNAKKATEAKKTKSSTKKTSDSKKTKKTSTTTRSKPKTKGGNFLGAVGDLVAPTGWGPFATAAGLLALDRADAALRREMKEKKEKMKGGKCENMAPHNSLINTRAITEWSNGKINNYSLLNNKSSNLHKNSSLLLYKSKLENPLIKIICDNDVYNLQLMGTCGNDTFVYTNDQTAFMSKNLQELKDFISNRANQLRFIRSCLLSPQLKGKCVLSSS